VGSGIANGLPVGRVAFRYSCVVPAWRLPRAEADDRRAEPADSV